MAPPKAKGQKMGLGEFLTDASLGSWADEMEDVPVPSGNMTVQRSKCGLKIIGARSGYSAERSNADWGRGVSHSGILLCFASPPEGAEVFQDRGYPPRESLPLPTKPPFTVHLGNMSFDATEGDIQAFFEGCQVTSVRIVEDRLDRKPKGFAYAEFATLEGLKKALEFNGSQFQGRNIRVSVAEPQKERSEGRELLDWTRKGPLPEMPSRGSTERPSSGARGPDSSPDFGSDRPRRPGYEHGDGKQRDFSNWERKGPLTPALSSTTSGRNFDRPTSHDGPRDRRNSPAWGEGRSQDTSRPPRRDAIERPAAERTPTAAELDTQWRSKMRPDPPMTNPQVPPKDVQRPLSPGPGAGPPSTRPKLNLQKRTVSQAEASPSLPTGNLDAKASPFGAAKPIDTSARDKEIEQKLKQRKEQEDKAREEKKMAEEKAKDKRQSKEPAKSDQRLEKGKIKPNGQPADEEQRENHGKNYRILKRDAGEADSEAGEEKSEAGVVARAGVDGHVKPQEIVRDLNGAGKADSSADQLQEEGWSTVSKSSRGRRGGNGAARAIAS